MQKVHPGRPWRRKIWKMKSSGSSVKGQNGGLYPFKKRLFDCKPRWLSWSTDLLGPTWKIASWGLLSSILLLECSELLFGPGKCWLLAWQKPFEFQNGHNLFFDLPSRKFWAHSHFPRILQNCQNWWFMAFPYLFHFTIWNLGKVHVLKPGAKPYFDLLKISKSISPRSPCRWRIGIQLLTFLYWESQLSLATRTWLDHDASPPLVSLSRNYTGVPFWTSHVHCPGSWAEMHCISSETTFGLEFQFFGCLKSCLTLYRDHRESCWCRQW